MLQVEHEKSDRGCAPTHLASKGIMGRIGCSNPCRVKPMTYTSCYLVWHLVLIGQDKDWLAQDKDNVTEWDIQLSCLSPRLPVGQSYHECVLTQVTSLHDMILDVAGV